MPVISFVAEADLVGFFVIILRLILLCCIPVYKHGMTLVGDKELVTEELDEIHELEIGQRKYSRYKIGFPSSML